MTEDTTSEESKTIDVENESATTETPPHDAEDAEAAGINDTPDPEKTQALAALLPKGMRGQGLITAGGLSSEETILQMQERRKLMEKAVAEGILRRNRGEEWDPHTDFGILPGTTTTTLYLAGAQVLAVALGLRAQYEINQTLAPNGHLSVMAKCILHKEDYPVSEMWAGCTTHEDKYKYTKADPEPILDNADEQVPFPKRGWGVKGKHRDRFLREHVAELGIEPPSDSKWMCHVRGEGGEWVVGVRDSEAKVEHPNPASFLNTILKIAQKRAFTGAILQIVGRSWMKSAAEQNESDDARQDYGNAPPRDYRDDAPPPSENPAPSRSRGNSSPPPVKPKKFGDGELDKARENAERSLNRIGEPKNLESVEGRIAIEVVAGALLLGGSNATNITTIVRAKPNEFPQIDKIIGDALDLKGESWRTDDESEKRVREIMRRVVIALKEETKRVAENGSFSR